MLAACSLATALALLAPLPSALPTPQADDVDATVTELIAAFGDSERKYAALAREVQRALEKQAVPDHPWTVLVTELAEAGRADAQRRKNTPRAKELLERFPWEEELELVRGLEFGSDRPVPDHQNGFIVLEQGGEGFPGFPDLLVNEYLWGLDEIAGWQVKVGGKKKPEFEGRTARDAVQAVDELPPLEVVRLGLMGYPPELALFALPELKRRLHRQLVERRRGEDGRPDRVDQALAFHDSKWNGFLIGVPWMDDPLPVVRPVHALYTRRNGFLNHYPRAVELSQVGDIPFLAVQSMAQHAAEFGEGTTDVRVYVGAEGGSPGFQAESAWLSRYKSLLELFAFALLAPDTRYPGFLAIYDYPSGTPPAERSAGCDVTRAQALLVWAHAGGDPAAVADFLHDELLGLEASACPADVALPAAFTVLVRERQAELLTGVAERVRAERATGDGSPGAFERQFSPFPTYLETEGEPTLGALVHSFHSYQALAVEAPRAAARELVADAL